MAISHVAHGATLQSIIGPAWEIGPSGFSGIQAGDLVCVMVQWGTNALFGGQATIPSVIRWPNDSFVEIDRETGGYSTGSGVGGKTTIAYGFAEGGETYFGVGTDSDTTGRLSCAVMVDVFRGTGTDLTAIHTRQISYSDPIYIPSLSPDEGLETVIWAPFMLCPDYHPSVVSAGWTLTSEVFGGARQSVNTAYRLEASTAGSYSGTIDGFSDVGETGAICYVVAFQTTPPPPVPKVTFGVNEVEFDGLLEKTVRIEYNGTGSGAFVIPRGHAQATEANLARGNLVWVRIPEIDPDPIFEFFIETGDFDLISTDEEGGEELSFAGPGSLSYLRRAKVHFEPQQSPASVVKLSRGTWEWVNQEAGDIIERLVSEAVDRDVLPDLTYTFTETEDSDGNPWTPMGSWKEDIGADLLEAVMRLVAAGQLQVEMGPGLVLNLYETTGNDRSSSSFAAGKVRFVKGVNITDEVGRSMAGLVYGSHALVRGDDGSWREVELASYPYKAEIVVEVGSHASSVMDAAGLRALGAREDAQTAIIFGVTVPYPGAGSSELDGLYLPGPDWSENGQYWVGDLVTLHTGTGEHDYDNATFRVYAITLREDATGYLDMPIVELGSPWAEPDRDSNLDPVPSSGGGSSSGSGGGSSGGGTHSHSQYQLGADDKWKQPVRVATTADLTISTGLNAGDTVDGVTLVEGDRVLVRAQATPSQNGIYQAGTAPTRTGDFDTGEEVLGAVVLVVDGTTLGGKLYRLDATTEPVVNADALTFTEVAGGSGSGDATGYLLGGFDGGGGAIAAGSIYYGVVPFDGTIDGWIIQASGSADAEFDVAIAAAGTRPTFPADSIVASAPPSMTGDDDAASSTLTGWDTGITAGQRYAIRYVAGTAEWAQLLVTYSR